jgi:hypothetical protein
MQFCVVVCTTSPRSSKTSDTMSAEVFNHVSFLSALKGDRRFTGGGYVVTCKFPIPSGARKEVVDGLYQDILPRSRCKNGIYAQLFQFLHIILRYYTAEYNLNPVI